MNKVADFFDTLADRWDELCYHDPEKLNDILQRTDLRKGLRILDIGCGTGVLESYLCPIPLTNRGSGYLSGNDQKARSKYATPIVDFRCQDVRDMQERSFDYIIAYSVFPHFQKQSPILAGLLPVGGELVVCHSESRDRINGHHDKHAGKLGRIASRGRGGTHVIPFLHCQHDERSPVTGSIVSATRKQTF